VLPTGNGFGLTGNGDQVYIPHNVMSASKAQMGHEMFAKLVNNDRDPAGRTPWMAIYLSATPPASVSRDLSTEVINALAEGYMTTKEVAEELGIDVAEANTVLNNMFANGQLVKASVHAKPNQMRASFLLWAKDINQFL
jgi:hypothetical protein